MHLKSRTEFPPGEFQICLPEIGMKASLHGSFREMVAAFLAVVKRNPALAQQLGWPTTQAGAEAFVDDRECRRLITQGWSQFVDLTGPTDQTQVMDIPVKKNILGRVVAVAQASKAGIKYWLEAFGPDGKPVDIALAERRAAVCVPCVENDLERRLEDYFILPTVNGVKFVYEMMRDLKLHTTVDDKLGICRACLCPLKAKVHGKLSHILKVTPEQTMKALPAHCWITKKDQ